MRSNLLEQLRGWRVDWRGPEYIMDVF